MVFNQIVLIYAIIIVNYSNLSKYAGLIGYKSKTTLESTAKEPISITMTIR